MSKKLSSRKVWKEVMKRGEKAQAGMCRQQSETESMMKRRQLNKQCSLKLRHEK